MVIGEELKIGADGRQTRLVNLERIKSDLAESMLPHSPPPEIVLEYPKFIVFVGVLTAQGSIDPVGVGWAEDKYFFTARHNTDKPSSAGYGSALTLFRPGVGKITFRPTKRYLLGLETDEYSTYAQTGYDIQAIEVPKNAWSTIGARPAKRCNYSKAAVGHVTLYALDGNNVIGARGNLAHDRAVAYQRGLLGHTGATMPGFSGGPGVLLSHGVQKISMMHICGDILDNFHNYGSSFHHIMELRRICGIDDSGTIYERFIGAMFNETESPLPVDEQEEHELLKKDKRRRYKARDLDLRDESQYQRDLKAAARHDHDLQYGGGEGDSHQRNADDARSRTAAIAAGAPSFRVKKRQALQQPYVAPSHAGTLTEKGNQRWADTVDDHCIDKAEAISANYYTPEEREMLESLQKEHEATSKLTSIAAAKTKAAALLVYETERDKIRAVAKQRQAERQVEHQAIQLEQQAAKAKKKAEKALAHNAEQEALQSTKALKMEAVKAAKLESARAIAALEADLKAVDDEITLRVKAGEVVDPESDDSADDVSYEDLAENARPSAPAKTSSSVASYGNQPANLAALAASQHPPPFLPRVLTRTKPRTSYPGFHTDSSQAHGHRPFPEFIQANMRDQAISRTTTSKTTEEDEYRKAGLVDEIPHPFSTTPSLSLEEPIHSLKNPTKMNHDYWPIGAKVKYWKDNVSDPTPVGTFIGDVPQKEVSDARLIRALEQILRGNFGKLWMFKNVGTKRVMSLPGTAFYQDYLNVGNLKRKHISRLGPSICMTDKNNELYALRGATVESKWSNTCSTQSMDPEVLSTLKSLGVDMYHPTLGSEFIFPPSGPEAMINSLRVQAKKISVKRDWSKLQAEPTFDRKYSEFLAETPVCEPGLCHFATLFDDIVDGFDPLKSSGWSARKKPGTKAAWMIGTGKAELKALVIMRIILRMANIGNLGTMTPLSMIEAGVMDPCEGFIKVEAHKASKAETGTWRLIWVTSIVDFTLQCILHQDHNKEDIRRYSLQLINGICVGMGHHDLGIAQTGRVFEWVSGPELEALKDQDAAQWDITVARDMIMFDADRRNQCTTRVVDGVDVDDCMLAYNRELMIAEGLCNSAHVLVGNTDAWELQAFGTTSSGTGSTTSQNSTGRKAQALFCGAERAAVLGDDLVAAGEMSLTLMESCGTICKPTTTNHHHGPVDFTSHSYTKVDGSWHARFLNFRKMLAHVDLRRKPGQAPSRECLGGCAFVLRHSPEETAILVGLVEAMGWAPPGTPALPPVSEEFKEELYDLC
jgi:hypothetical protein